MCSEFMFYFLELSRIKKNIFFRDFPGGPVAKTLCSQDRGPEFDTWPGN